MTEPEPRPQAPLDTERVRAHARRVLDSESFSKAHSLRRFLAYVVDETLAGRADTLKEYAIGVEVFGRGEGFDPRADTIVRVQARRLRSKLEQYYAVAGQELLDTSTHKRTLLSTQNILCFHGFATGIKYNIIFII